MDDHTILLIMLAFDAAVGIVVPLEFAINEYRHRRGQLTAPSIAPAPAMRWRVLALLSAFLLVAAAAVVYPRLTQPTPLSGFTPAWLTPERQKTFRSGALSIIQASGNPSSTKIETVAEPESGTFAYALVDMFITSGLPIQIDGKGNRVVGNPAKRLETGITVVAPVPSLGAETVRVGFERVGIQTRRSTDPSRTGDYLIVEVGPAP